MKRLMTIAMMLAGGLLFAQEVRTETYENGQTKTQYTVYGNYIEMIAFYQDGQVKETGSYLANKPHGEYRQYNEAGDLISAGEYVNGEKEGIWLYRAGGGDMLYQIEYVDNVRTTVNRWVAVE
ncbi:MAG: hypothetical protein EP346_07470 [Bacteroidetes bacterium]|uniref:Nicotinic acid mononucleotide adenyltransferase n=1 Tax=Phaeocystidibacter marisrubri TaxID=1577780 RepID=A0A6L3ZGR2_9FLAO|nr:hypothetical protein [Phaeocystidibacter marisrubri]KAB2817101.1 hypothetical protein F8C82_01505 [Phaeocystidibacter marisrubri]TNE29042.1 MAG: hypothetical protein EP346_07470 [Bacteroidota bacterium]